MFAQLTFIRCASCGYLKTCRLCRQYIYTVQYRKGGSLALQYRVLINWSPDPAAIRKSPESINELINNAEVGTIKDISLPL